MNISLGLTVIGLCIPLAALIVSIFVYVTSRQRSKSDEKNDYIREKIVSALDRVVSAQAETAGLLSKTYDKTESSHKMLHEVVLDSRDNKLVLVAAHKRMDRIGERLDTLARNGE